jgi:potassium-transporting ATPase KdpC subunit
MNAYFRPAFTLLLLFTLITGVAYPLAITGFTQAVLPAQANGSLVVKDGKVIGSSLIGQSFTSERYFHGRPSATSTADPASASKTIDAPYNAASSSGSNLGPSSKALKDAVTERAAAVGTGPAPADLVTASASGLDPHISPEAAIVQIARIAKARSIAEPALRILVDRLIEGRDFAVLGERRINVLALNLALDALKP